MPSENTQKQPNVALAGSTSTSHGFGKGSDGNGGKGVRDLLHTHSKAVSLIGSGVTGVLIGMGVLVWVGLVLVSRMLELSRVFQRA